jgi:hypothetical protein
MSELFAPAESTRRISTKRISTGRVSRIAALVSVALLAVLAMMFAPAASAQGAATPAESVRFASTCFMGCGATSKQYVQVAPLAGSAYSGTPDMTGAHVVVTDTTSPGVVLDCWTVTTDGFCLGGNTGASFFIPVTGHSYTIAQQVASGGSGAPRGFLGGTTIDYVGPSPCVVPSSIADPLNPAPSCTYPDVVLHDPGAYRSISLTISSSVDATKKLGGAIYHLCSITTGAPVITGAACPASSTELAKATSDASGLLNLANLYVPANDPGNPNGKYTVFESATQAGYLVDTMARVIEVPAAFADTGTGVLPLSASAPSSIAEPKAELVIPLLTFPFTNIPDVPAPVAVNDGASTVVGAAIVIPVETNDNGQGAPITLLAVSTPANGTAVIVDGAISYTPNPGFAGTDTFTYTISTRGGQATATVTVTIPAPAAAAVVPVALASTGDSDLKAMYGGLGVLVIGTALTAAAVIGRRRPDARI